jgi:hypothetical protein
MLIFFWGCNQRWGPNSRKLWEVSTFERRLWHGYCHAGKPSISDSFIFHVGGYHWDAKVFLFSIDRLTGSIRWKRGPFKAASDPIIGNGQVLIRVKQERVEQTQLVAYDLVSGDRVEAKINESEIYDAKSKLLEEIRSQLSSEVFQSGDRLIYQKKVLDAENLPTYSLEVFSVSMSKPLWSGRPSVTDHPPFVFQNRVYSGSGMAEQKIYAFDLDSDALRVTCRGVVFHADTWRPARSGGRQAA